MGDLSSEKLVSFEVVESASLSALEEVAGDTAEVDDVIDDVIEVTVEVTVTLVPLDVTRLAEAAEAVEAALEGDFALDGIKGTEAGFKLDLMLMDPDPDCPDWLVVRFGKGLSLIFNNAFVAAACLAAWAVDPSPVTSRGPTDNFTRNSGAVVLVVVPLDPALPFCPCWWYL